jgi:hypothetical protein
VEPDAWIPLDVTSPQFMQNGAPVGIPHYLSVVGRLAPGVTVERARQEISATTRRRFGVGCGRGISCRGSLCVASRTGVG